MNNSYMGVQIGPESASTSGTTNTSQYCEMWGSHKSADEELSPRTQLLDHKDVGGMLLW